MQLKTLFDEHQGKCHFCGHDTHLRTKGMPRAACATREHLRPWVLGGRNGDNVVLACSRCNNLKSEMPADAFAEIAKTLPPPVQFLRGKERRAVLESISVEHSLAEAGAS
jgi:5-methylcytosine-specific restriction endonuclease McrA